jgi:hypothetical protein
MFAGSEKESSCSWVGSFTVRARCFDRYPEREQGESRQFARLQADLVGRFAGLASGAIGSEELGSHLHRAISGYILMQNAIALCAA